jgi:hypothetical protein
MNEIINFESMFSMMKKLLLILYMFNFSSVVSGEEFPDGKYFASVLVTGQYMNDRPRWTVIINKENNKIEVLSLNINESNVGCCCCTLDIPDIDLSDRLIPIDIVNNKFDFGRIKFVKNIKIWFYGVFGKFSKITFSIYPQSGIEARFKWVPYKHYETFQNMLEEDSEFNTDDLLKI